MSKQKVKENLDQKIEELKKDIRFLKSFLIGILGKDKEGEYNPEFVKEVLRIAKKKPCFKFKSKKVFLEELKKV